MNESRFSNNADASWLLGLSLLTAGLGAACSAAGLFWVRGGAAAGKVSNAYGQIVQLHGRGLYRHDTTFKAPILRGTDVVVLVVGVPMLLAAILWARRGGLRARLFLLGALSCFVYHASSIAFGVAYNPLHLLYIAYASASFFAFVLAFRGVDLARLERSVRPGMPRRVLAAFLAVAGLSALAWLPEGILALVQGRPLHHLGHYTTEVTHVIDVGVIAPSAFCASSLLLRRHPLAYPLAAALLVLLAFIGLVVAGQSIMQWREGIRLSAVELALYVTPFLVLSAVSFVLVARMAREIDTPVG